LIAIHASSTIESGAPQIDCLALFVHPSPSYSEPHELIVIHASSVIKYGASSEGKMRFFCYFPNRFPHQTCVYVYIMLFLFVCLFVLCCAKKEEGETGVTYFKSFWVGTIVIEIN